MITRINYQFQKKKKNVKISVTKNLIYQKKLTEKINDNDILPKAQVEILLKKR